MQKKTPTDTENPEEKKGFFKRFFTKKNIICIGCFVAILIAYFCYVRYIKPLQAPTMLGSKEFFALIKQEDAIVEITIEDREAIAYTKEESEYKGKKFIFIIDKNSSFDEMLSQRNIKPDSLPVRHLITSSEAIGSITQYVWFFVAIITVGFTLHFGWMYIRGKKNIQQGFRKKFDEFMKGPMFGASHNVIKEFVPEPEKTKCITFNDIGGQKEAVEKLKKLVDSLKNPERYKWRKPEKGYLFVGPPGVGKTHLARAIAYEAGVPFFYTSGSEFLFMFVGVGPDRVKKLFAKAKEKAPCIIFIDELDALGSREGPSFGGGDNERKSTINQILVEMDGFDSNTNVFVIAATNSPNLLDSAARRSGRLAIDIYLPVPDINGRFEIAQIHARGIPIDGEENAVLKALAQSTPGLTGADIQRIINEATVNAEYLNKNKVTLSDLLDAAIDLELGDKLVSRILSKEEKDITGVHEGSHALAAHFTPTVDAPTRISNIPRGFSLGHTNAPPEKERYMKSKERALGELIYMLGGRAGEIVKFGEEKMTTGAAGDIAAATNLARDMVTKWGFSKKLGPVYYADPPAHYSTIGGEGKKQYSEKTAEDIDGEIKELVNNALMQAISIIKTNEAKLDQLKEALDEYETLEKDQIEAILGKRPNPVVKGLENM